MQISPKGHDDSSESVGHTLMVLVPRVFWDTLDCFTFCLRLTSDEVFHLEE